jgi:hypothetical protein
LFLFALSGSKFARGLPDLRTDDGRLINPAVVVYRPKRKQVSVLSLSSNLSTDTVPACRQDESIEGCISNFIDDILGGARTLKRLDHHPTV